MLQAYVDESVSLAPGSRLFVMGGYIATIEEWMAFSNDWAKTLSLNSPHFRSIEEFKASVMHSSATALEQSMFFYRVIERHLKRYIVCTVWLDDLAEEHRRVQWPKWLDNVDILASDYFTAFNQLIHGIAQFQGRLGFDAPIDVIFDNHTGKSKCMRAWDIMKKYGHSSLRPKLGAKPMFRDSKEAMPLQAADLLCYWARESVLKTPLESPTFKLDFPWAKQSTAMMGIGVHCTREMVRNNFHDIVLSCSLLKAGARPEQASTVVAMRRRAVVPHP